MGNVKNVLPWGCLMLGFLVVVRGRGGGVFVQ